jgi:hypothetical protein
MGHSSTTFSDGMHLINYNISLFNNALLTMVYAASNVTVIINN